MFKTIYLMFYLINVMDFYKYVHILNLKLGLGQQKTGKSVEHSKNRL